MYTKEIMNKEDAQTVVPKNFFAQLDRRTDNNIL